MTDDQQTQTPPWGDDFDAAKAWTLVQALRADKAKLTTDLSSERQAREAAEKAAQDADPEGKLKAAVERAEKAEKASAVKDVLLDFPALKGFEDFLTGSTPEELKASAEKLASLGKPAADQETKGEETPKAPTSTQPEPQLTPGHGGEQTTPFDADAIASAARR